MSLYDGYYVDSEILLHRIGMGGFYASIIQPLEPMGRFAEVGLRIGMAFTLVSGGVVAGTPLLGELFDSTGSYKNVGYCGGESVPFEFVFMLTDGACGVKSRFDSGVVSGPCGCHKALNAQVRGCPWNSWKMITGLYTAPNDPHNNLQENVESFRRYNVSKHFG